MTKDELIEERRRALNLLQAFEAGHIMSLDENTKSDLTNAHTETQIDALREQIGELERRIEGHPDC
jgi:ABC-type arginine transport system ATPase subunit